MTASSKAYFATPWSCSVAANFDPRKRVTACPQSPRPFSYVLSCNARCCVSIHPDVIDGRNLGGTRAMGRRNGSERARKMPGTQERRLNIRHGNGRLVRPQYHRIADHSLEATCPALK